VLVDLMMLVHLDQDHQALFIHHQAHIIYKEKVVVADLLVPVLMVDLVEEVDIAPRIQEEALTRQVLIQIVVLLIMDKMVDHQSEPMLLGIMPVAAEAVLVALEQPHLIISQDLVEME
tara:strand:- start:326 stop:679 length:354 start_codon:yes stop_codon:yes gene_type:complete